MGDFRKKLLINITGCQLGFIIDESTWEKDILQINILEQFLEDVNKHLLCACLEIKDNNKRIKYYESIVDSKQDSLTVVFSKHQKVPLRDDNLLQSIHITSMHGSPAAILYHSLNNVYGPLIIKSKQNNPSLEKHISNLQAGLRASLITELDDLTDGNENQSESIAMILTIDQEVEYWHKQSTTRKSSTDRTVAASFRDMLIPVAKDIAVLDALQISDVEDMEENSHNILDDLWRHEPPYPKARMEHIMEIISNDIVSYITKQFNKIAIWKEQYNKATELLEQCLAIGKRWLSSCRELTEIFWPNYSLHDWRGPPFVPENLANLVERLLQIKDIRATHRQLTRLLTKEEHAELNCDQMFGPFENFNALQYGIYSDHNWSSANKQFEYILKPAEETVALKLKKQFSTVKANTRQLLYEYGRYAELLARPVVRTILQSERQQFLSQLKEYVKLLSSQMSQTPTLSTKYETPQVVAEILGTRQLEARANDVLVVSRKILHDLDNYRELENNTTELLRDLKDQHTDLYEAWTSEMLEQIKSHNLSLCEDDPVVQFTPNKLMRVNYSPRLVSLISEVRQLTTLGYNIPEAIVTTSDHAKQFMNYAKYLDQIAHFHNTIGDIMIASQRPMMLPSAIALSKLVQEQEVVSWGNVKSVENYVQTLKSAVDKLSKENNLLSSYNAQVVELIDKLRGVDLIKYYDKWKLTTKILRDLMYQVQQKGFVASSMVQWKQEIDKRLANILEEQYIKSLGTVNQYLPEINCDLIYRDGTLKFLPDESVLKEKYEQQLKESIDIPKKFRGVSDSNEVFAQIIDKSKQQLGKVQENTTNIFEQLQGVKKHWQAWLTLDKLDVSKLNTWQDWELHFRASKTFGQEIAKLPSEEEKIGCFKIGLSWLRSDLESHNRCYWDQLVNTLKDSIAQDVVKLQDYVDSSTATLNRQPLTLEQIGETDASHADILNQKPEMEALHTDLMQKVHILSSWNRERIDAVNRMQAGWERLQNLMENYQHIIAKQMETIKTTLTIASENLNNEIERFGAKWDQIKPRPNSGQIGLESLEELNKHYLDIKEKKEQWLDIIQRQQKLLSDFSKFGLEIPEFAMTEEIEHDLNKEEAEWSQFEKFYQGLEALGNEEWIVFRKKYYKLQDYLSEWENILEGVENSPLITRLLQEIHKYQAATPILKTLKGEDFTDKHWLEVYDALGIMPKSLDVLTLKDFLRISDRLVEKQTQLQAISKKAASEIIVRQTLSELDQWDVQAKFQLTAQVDSKGKDVLLIKDFKEHLSKIGDHQSLLQSVKNSSDYEAFAGRADVWETRLTDLDLYLTELAQIQRKWIYLEPIFGSGTLAHEKTRFDKLDREFRSVLNFIERDSRVCAILRYANLRATLTNVSEQLSRCQKGLDEFLAEKRDKFPRFLFLGDDDLLEVVGQSSKEHVIQSHLKKLFAGIHSTVIDDSGKNITAMRSLQGETVQLLHPININQPVELWLNQLVKEMQGTLQELLVQCLGDGKSPDPLKYPSQILCLSASIHFTNNCEQAIGSMGLPQLLTTYKDQLTYYSNVDVSNDAESSLLSMETDSESNLLELKLKALLLDTIQYIDLIEMLIANNVTKLTDWQWQEQLRFYATISGAVTVKMVNAEMNYSFEYIGNTQKLVRTPLTEKCFLTLTQGMHLGMGGNPYGPAGTGKTESVKALGALLGRQVLVFNCDEGIDAASMGRILSGLVRSGAWGCFDEFNRLDEATLSAISMYIQPIQNALRTHSSVVTLLDKEIQVNPYCGIFVTLNPAGGGYGGRNKLPDNLKQLFRPVVMTHPDHEQIARTLLHCDGYQNADVIGRKLVELFELSSKLLSKQQHYDWGLRALRTVLTACGRTIKEYKKTNQVKNETEYTLVINATRLDTLSKLTYNDAIIFENLVKDIFPRIETPINSGNTNMIQALHDSFADLKLQANKRQIGKCMELYEQLRQRMGVALVGPPKSGKSTIRNLLVNALSKQGTIIKQHVFNPKAMPRTQLLGQIDNDTRQWTDGVLTLYSLEVINEPLDVVSFIVCDGDVDPEWVESLNSVMDDNRLLSLPSGWRVQFGPNVNFIFETHDLSHASPATISRMGIVFLSEEDVELQGFVETYLARFSEEEESLTSTWIEDYFYNAMDWMVNQGELVLHTPKLSLAKTALTLIKDTYNKENFIVNLIDGFGGQLEHDFREVFAQQMFEVASVNIPAYATIARYEPKQKSIDSYTSDAEPIKISEDNIIPLILTGQVKHSMGVIQKWFAQNGEHVLIVGPHGSAKTLLIDNIHDTSDLGNIAVLHCSAHVTPQYAIHKIIQYCLVVSSSRGKIYRPKRGHLTLFLKNLHLLKADKWGTNMLTAFLQQLITYNGFFDANLEWVLVENITVVGTMANTNNLSTRFTSLFNVFNVDLPETEDLNTIFTLYMSAILKKANIGTWPKQKITKLTGTLLKVYQETKENFSQVNKRHYVFSPHDLTLWCRGILRYKLMSNDLETTLLEVICNEALKIFYDRLVTNDDRVQFKDILNRIITQDWNKPNILGVVIDHYFVASSMHNRTVTALTKLNADDWSTIVKKGIIQYEREGYSLNIEVIPELLYLTSALSRALTTPGGHALLVGNSGVGRRSAVKIISVLEGAKLIVPIGNDNLQFKNDLKNAMISAGIDGEHIYLILEDHILNKPNNLNMLNTLLSSGEVPGLFNNTELDSLITGLKDEASRTDFDGNLYDFFVERTMSHLHILICVELQNTQFWNILENCPAIIQKCTQIWMSEWSKETMKMIPNLIIKKRNEKSKNDEKIEISKYFSEIEGITKKELSSPYRYINMVNSYINIYSDKQKNLLDQQKKLQGGISKLTEAGDVVADLKIKASEQQQKLAEKQKAANKALDMISNTMKNANVKKEQMEVLKIQTEKENIQLVKRKKEIDLELAEVEPLIQQARNAIGNIKSEALSEIRSLRAPPEVIRDILEGVLRLMGIQDTSWNSMKTFLAKRGVKEDIRAFDAGRITVANRETVEKLIATKHDSFEEKNAKRASIAAAPLASWVTANVRYSKVMQKIKPLEREQNQLKENLTEAESQLTNLSAGLMDVDATVEQLKKELSKHTREGAEIEIKLNSAQETLQSAEGLVGKLIDEYERWQKQLKELEVDLKKLPSNCLLAAAFLNYLSGESEDVRRQIMTNWLEIVKGDLDHFVLEEFLSSEREQMQWQNDGLATDPLSIQNAIIINKDNMCPFLIDPTSMGINWIKSRYKDKSFEVTTQISTKFNTSLELAIRFGKVFFIEEVEEISAILLTLLRKQFIQQGERTLINLNGKLIDYNKDFKLLLSSRNANLQIPGELTAIINVINFTTTRAGLTEQLLISAIKQESPELAERRKNLLRQREELQEKQHKLQVQLLEDLATSKGNILENKNLLASLNETKASSVAITEALAESSQVQEKLMQEYDVYREISQFGSSLYFGAREFLKTNVLYALSVASFTKLFLSSLPTLEGLQSTENYRHKILIQALFQYMGRGIFKSDRLKFLLYLVYKMFPDQIPDQEWNILIGNVLIANRPETSKNREAVPTWIANASVTQVSLLQIALPNIYITLDLDNEMLWKDFMQNPKCETSFPKHCKLTEFQKVLVVQALRTDRLYSAMSQCVLHLTGMNNYNLEVLNLAQIYKESNSTQPILLITTSGNDPSTAIREVAMKEMNSDKYVEMSMGEGQEHKAIATLQETAQSGKWLILKNLHLVTSWLPSLCQNLQEITPTSSFRLWLVTEANPKFSPVLAENSLKLAYEAPVGVRNNLYKIFTTYGTNFVQSLNSTASRIFFILGLVHAILQERRSYIPQGWSKWYEFSDVDLSSMVKLTEELWENASSHTMQWKYLIGWAVNAVYGGRIEKREDLILLNACVRQYFTDEVLSHRWKPLGILNSMPSSSNYQDYLNFITHISLKDIPAYFGLPENIDRSWERNTSANIIQYLKNVSITKEIASGYEQVNKNLLLYVALWKKLNHGQDFIRATIPNTNQTDYTMETFIIEELRFALNIIQTLHKCFSHLNKMAKGHVLGDEKYNKIAEELFSFKTPNTWLKLWDGPKEPARFLKDLISKTITISQWNNNATTYYHQPMNIALLFNADTFLAAFKKQYASNRKLPVDELELKSYWKPKDGSIILSGLQIEGALFDGINLLQTTANSESFNPTPDVYIVWEEKRTGGDERLLQIPLYYTTEREKLLTNLYVPCSSKDKLQWIQASVAFILHS